jgi:hypothetical protein
MSAVPTTQRRVRPSAAQVRRPFRPPGPAAWYRFLIGLLVFSQAAFGAGTVSREDQIKAAFLYNFAKFIDWPPSSFADPSAPFVIGILGETPIASVLDELVRDRKIGGRKITVRRVQSVAEAASTHMLFVSASDLSQWLQVQPAIEAKPVVTVGEAPSFVHSGGVINFIRQEDKVRFEISMPAVERCGVRVSSQLLILAVVGPPLR